MIFKQFGFHTGVSERLFSHILHDVVLDRSLVEGIAALSTSQISVFIERPLSCGGTAHHALLRARRPDLRRLLLQASLFALRVDFVDLVWFTTH